MSTSDCELGRGMKSGFISVAIVPLSECYKRTCFSNFSLNTIGTSILKSPTKFNVSSCVNLVVKTEPDAYSVLTLWGFQSVFGFGFYRSQINPISQIYF